MLILHFNMYPRRVLSAVLITCLTPMFLLVNLSNVNHPKMDLSSMNLSTWLVSVIAAVLILVLSDAWLGRQKISH